MEEKNDFQYTELLNESFSALLHSEVCVSLQPLTYEQHILQLLFSRQTKLFPQ